MKAAKAVKILSMNPFMNSLSSQDIAKRQLKEIKEWWEINVDNYKNESSISESDFDLMRKFLQLPDIAKYRNLNGPKITYYNNGQIEEELYYKNGGKHGIQKGWYENGQLMYEHNYIFDHMDGKQKSWYENGQLMSENSYKFTTPNLNCLSENSGWQKEYYENGNLKEENFYNENEFKIEKSIKYHENGLIKESRVYINDQIIRQEYDSDGKIKKETSS
jgi:antitoxin component YwqK of YwqJK toxin-antitoxin module